MSGLLSIFNVAKRGMSAQQYSIGITNHNVANANTEGYSRQRAQLQTSNPFMAPSMNSYIGPGQLGTGVEVATVQRVRNEFIDFQIRGELSTQGKYEAREALLSEVENIYNEPSDTGISGLLGKFYDSWQQLSKQPQSSNARTVVAQQSKALADELNHNYNQLNKLKENTNLQIKESVFRVNNVLEQIDDLNQQIISVKVSEQEPNDLMDRRDLLIDELSSLLNVDVKKQSFYGQDITAQDSTTIPGGAEKLLVRKDPNMSVSRFTYISGVTVKGDKMTLETYKLGNSNEVGEPITVDLSAIDPKDRDEVIRQIKETRVLWANQEGTSYAELNGASSIVVTKDDFRSKLGLFEPSKGKLNGLQSVQEDVDKYMERMDKLAKGLAMAVNSIHSGVTEIPDEEELKKLSLSDYKDADGKLITVVVNKKDDAGNVVPHSYKMDFLPFFINGEEAEYDENGNMTNLKTILMSEDEITAGNITINEEILKDVMKIKTKTDDDDYSYTENNKENGNTDGNRALTIAQLRNAFMKIGDVEGEMTREFFISKCTGDGTTGGLVENSVGVKTIKNNTSGMTSDNYFKDVIDELGIQTQEAKRIGLNQTTLISGFQQAKESVSGVSLDEEMASLIQYQHAYSANAKIVSTVDELLDVVINGLKR
ncbi:flagellar hook-associated protein FlgK [Oceanirhabdus seepicola]|uniref:Flagellar hook-associated protein 1 n=1 Tax=Oceanirhabdus seepicola TaxID=2828781 RepID=A0A9J6NUI1_9CLOT|nr:flagellar hook-associated protein FlgK [Oceanirhabdus seepicola]MCM1988114.1 flagellar hook-associated protein FlgK [Oceanirhabdus seepicola]